ncbi:hypothetical protein TNCV_538141 [Trichonephila clavipes]|nr:hypothetical protein TNCV_538141 [Trichonephila clavipes]
MNLNASTVSFAAMFQVRSGSTMIYFRGHNCRQEVVTLIVIPDEMNQSSAEPLSLLEVVQKLGTQQPITEMIMNYAVNRTVTDVHTLCQLIDAYPPFLLNQLINIRNCVGGNCEVAIAQFWIVFATFTSFSEPFAPMLHSGQ